MPQMTDDAVGEEALAHFIKIDAPRVRCAVGDDLELFGYGMKSPDSAIHAMALLCCVSRIDDHRVTKDTMAAVHPTVRAPTPVR